MSAAIKNGGQAFPVTDPQAVHAIAAAAIEGITDTAERDRIYVAVRGQAAQGMTLRDYFAAQALPVAFSIFDSAAQGNVKAKHVAILSYQLADAMLRAREGGAS